eukprot:1025437-Lingulodinium_polyedra.AAC.1
MSGCALRGRAGLGRRTGPPACRTPGCMRAINCRAPRHRGGGLGGGSFADPVHVPHRASCASGPVAAATAAGPWSSQACRRRSP